MKKTSQLEVESLQLEVHNAPEVAVQIFFNYTRNQN